MTAFRVHHKYLPVKVKKHLETRIARLRHVLLLSH